MQRLLSAYQYLPHTFGGSAWGEAESRALEQAVLTVVQVRYQCATILYNIRRPDVVDFEPLTVAGLHLSPGPMLVVEQRSADADATYGLWSKQFACCPDCVCDCFSFLI